MKRLFFVILAMTTLLNGCQQAEPEAAVEAYVEANPAYLKHFGQPPQVKEGRAYARVGYLPLRSDPAQVLALPLYLYNEEKQIEQVLERLVSGDLLLPEQSSAYDPFAGGVTIERVVLEGSRLQVAIKSLQQKSLADTKPLVRALTETACQFEAVEQVQLLLDGKTFPDQPADGFSSQPELIAAVGDPQLLLVAGVWEPGADDPEELMISFDRPVSVNSFRVLDEAGEQIGGKYFASIFNMAVVIHPERPEVFRVGTPLNISWDVTDHLGRRNSGLDKLSLKRYEH